MQELAEDPDMTVIDRPAKRVRTRIRMPKTKAVEEAEEALHQAKIDRARDDMMQDGLGGEGGLGFENKAGQEELEGLSAEFDKSQADAAKEEEEDEDDSD